MAAPSGLPRTGTPAPARVPTVPAPTPGHRRDRLTLTLYTFFITWGWLLYTFSPAMPLIAAEQGITKAEAGLHGTAMAAGTVLSAFVSARLAARIGRRATLLVAGATLVGGVGVLVLGPVTAVTLVGALVTAVGGSLAVSAAQPALAVHHGEGSTSAVSEANGVGALFGLVAPLALGASVALGWGWRPAVALTTVLGVGACVLLTRLPAQGALGRPAPTPALPAVAPADPADTSEAAVDAAPGATLDALPPVTGRRFSRAYWCFWLALIAAVAVENATTFWVADLVAVRTGAGPGIATGALAGLIGGMCVARFTLGRLLRRRSAEALLVVAFAVGVSGWLLLWTTTSTAVALAGLVVAGLGYGAQYPLAISLVLRASEGRPDRAQASSTLGVGLAVGVAPFLLGALADRLGSHTAFVLVPALMAGGVAAVALGRRAARAA